MFQNVEYKCVKNEAIHWGTTSNAPKISEKLVV
jgi:hypothetical protein